MASGTKRASSSGAPAEDARNRVLGLIPPGGTCVELGSWQGDYAAMIPRRARPRALHLIDPWRFVPTLPRRWYGGALAHSQAEMDAIHAGVMARFANEPAVMIHRAPSVDAAPRFPVASIDFIYVDGDHSEDAVFADLNAWFPKCRPGGHIVCDDMFWRDEAGKASVAAAIERFVAQLPHGAATHELWENQFVFTRAQIEL